MDKLTSKRGDEKFMCMYILRRAPIDQLRIDNWPEPEGSGSKYTHGVSSGPFGG